MAAGKGGVEVRDQHSSEALQRPIKNVPFSTFSIKIGYFAETGKDPDVGALSFYDNACFVGVNQTASQHSRQNLLPGLFIESRGASLQVVHLMFVNSQPEHPVQTVRGRSLGHAKFDKHINYRANDVLAIHASSSEHFRSAVHTVAALAMVFTVVISYYPRP